MCCVVTDQRADEVVTVVTPVSDISCARSRSDDPAYEL